MRGSYSRLVIPREAVPDSICNDTRRHTPLYEPKKFSEQSAQFNLEVQDPSVLFNVQDRP